MKKSMLMYSVMACLSFGVAANDHLQSLHKETQIMENILTTSLKQDSRSKGIRFRKIESSYLAGQGVIFEVTTSSKGNFEFSFDMGSMLKGLESLEHLEHLGDVFDKGDLPPVPEVPPVPDTDGSFVFSFEMNDELEELMEDAEEKARDEVRENKERWRELREKERDLNWEKREYERNIRDIEFELRHAEDERRKELETRIARIQEDVQKLESRQQEIADLASKLENEEKSRKAKAQENRLKVYKRFLADFEATMADTLCDYGSGLKSLPDTEKVNFVLKDFSKGEDNRSRNNRRNDKLDKIYVISLADVKQCVIEKITPNELLTRSQTYMF